jgi:hypothetical protein
MNFGGNGLKPTVVNLKEITPMNNFEKFKKIAKENILESKKNTDIVLPKLPDKQNKKSFNNSSYQTAIAGVTVNTNPNLKINSSNTNNADGIKKNENNILPIVDSSKLQSDNKAKGLFINIHNKNLEHLKKLNGILEASKIRSSSSMKKETSIERFSRIKKFFNSNSQLNNQKIKKDEENKKEAKNSKFIYTYLIIRGNNSDLIKRCMQLRENWREAGVFEAANFRWQQSSSGLDFSLYSTFNTGRRIVNHFEYHNQISNKLNLLINMMKFCESRGLDVFDYIPMTILIQYDSTNFLKQFQNFKEFYNNINTYVIEEENLKMSRLCPKKSKLIKYHDLFTFNFQGDKLGTKTNVYIKHSHYDGKNMWVVKAVDLNRGRCIKICESVEKVEKAVKKFYNGVHLNFKENKEEEEQEKMNQEISPQKKIVKTKSSRDRSNEKNKYKTQNKSSKKNSESPGSNNDKNSNGSPRDKESKSPSHSKYKTSTMILQKYIERPALYRGRKFDIRLWVLVTHKMNVYAFKEGHLKATSVEYELNKTDTYVHLTNYSVQKYSDNFSKYEIGNEISFSDYSDFLKIQGGHTTVCIINESMYEIVKMTMLCVKDKLNVLERKFCFEIFGYDFILDRDYKPYLLEVNTNPGLEESSPLIKSLVPRMIDDALRLTVDSVFETNFNSATSESSFPVEGYSDEENMWQFICDLRNENKK